MAKKQRITYIDAFRGLVGIMMALGHSNYYFNSAWLSLDPLDPFFDNTPQFLLRYMGYLCAPGFLMMNGAMVHYVFQRRLQKGTLHVLAVPICTKVIGSSSLLTKRSVNTLI